MALPLRPKPPRPALVRDDRARLPVCAVPVRAYVQPTYVLTTVARDAVFRWRQGRMSGQQVFVCVGLATLADLFSTYANDRLSQAVPAYVRRTD